VEYASFGSANGALTVVACVVVVVVAVVAVVSPTEDVVVWCAVVVVVDLFSVVVDTEVGSDVATNVVVPITVSCNISNQNKDIISKIESGAKVKKNSQKNVCPKIH
jgi:hypothetical protein